LALVPSWISGSFPAKFFGKTWCDNQDGPGIVGDQNEVFFAEPIDARIITFGFSSLQCGGESLYPLLTIQNVGVSKIDRRTNDIGVRNLFALSILVSQLFLIFPGDG